MLKKQSVTDLVRADLEGKRVFVRVDFNVPFENGQISDDSRISEALPTINYLCENGAKVILASHLGRPKGIDDSLRLTPVAKRLAELVQFPVQKADECVGSAVESQVSGLASGSILLLENVRFHKEEEANDPAFAKQLASLADLFVLDAFGTAHRAHASTAGMAHYIPAYAGLLVKKEIEFLDNAISNPKRPFVAIIGGSKVSSKIDVLRKLLSVVDTLIIGGGMTFTFVKAQGGKIGNSLCEDSKIGEALQFLEDAKKLSKKVIFPTDEVITQDFSNESPSQIVNVHNIPDGWGGMDIGPDSIELFNDVINGAGTVLWNGPVGVFEMDNFSKGTFAIAKTLANSSAITIVGGGDSASAIRKANLSEHFSHISTGGGASLEFLEGKELPGIQALKDK